MTRAAPRRLRFHRDNSMTTEQGWHLFPGPALFPDAARAASATLRTVLQSYGHPPEDVTHDAVRRNAALQLVAEGYELFQYSAFVLSDGDHRVLVLRWNH